MESRKQGTKSWVKIYQVFCSLIIAGDLTYVMITKSRDVKQGRYDTKIFYISDYIEIANVILISITFVISRVLIVYV